MTKTTIKSVAALALIALVGTVGARAEDVEKRWRIGLNVGAYDARDGVTSDAANTLTITDPDDVPIAFFIDPRNDNAAINTLSIQPALITSLTAQYAATKTFLVQFDVGYSENTLGNIEVQAQFEGDPAPSTQASPFNFHIYNIPAGQLEQIPVQVTGLWRFRPRANLNPFVGLGIGYVFVGFTPSDELNELSRNIDGSIGVFNRIQTFPGGFLTGSDPVELTPATVQIDDTFEWHLSGGIEYSIAKSWSMIFDLRWAFSSRSIRVQFSGEDQLGISVPQKRVYADDPLADGTFGAIRVNEGGFIDGGRLVPKDPMAGTDCQAQPFACSFEFEPDGVPDPGFYYVRGGEIRYDAVTAMIGFRYTF